jgi:hypothetical protein
MTSTPTALSPLSLPPALAGRVRGALRVLAGDVAWQPGSGSGSGNGMTGGRDGEALVVVRWWGQSGSDAPAVLRTVARVQRAAEVRADGRGRIASVFFFHFIVLFFHYPM